MEMIGARVRDCINEAAPQTFTMSVVILPNTFHSQTGIFQ